MCQLKQNLQVKLFDVTGHNPQTSNCSQNTVQKWRSPPGTERNDEESTASLQCKTSTPVFTQWDNVLPSPALHSSLPWCTCVCGGVSGIILRKVTKAWHSNSTYGVEPTSDLGWRWSSDLVLFTTVCLQGDCLQLAGIALFCCAH